MSTTEYAPSLPLGANAVAPSAESRDADGPLVINSELRARRTRNSMLWAAYGDALGFISEMADERLLLRRTRGEALNRLIPWTRRVGGRNGAEVELPAGCWSDDTQLRLAVCRSLGNRGFDVETFANVELPVWPSYALGGGRASKAASKNLANPRVPWYANSFKEWANAGGNGAAMRIQPHVWASPRLDKPDHIMPVIENSVCTHGHPRALVGACFHAALLADCLLNGDVPSLDAAKDIAASLAGLWAAIEGHDLLGTFWVGQWQSASGEMFREGWNAAVCEVVGAIDATIAAIEHVHDSADAYEAVCRRLNLRGRNQVGSGVLTTVAATALAAVAEDAHSGCVTAANALGTDTDTIASMAGALLGASDSANEPPEPPLDFALLTLEADRLSALAAGEPRPGHVYPDLLRWIAPSAQADALVCDEHGLVVEGLGPVVAINDAVHWSPNRDFAWRWVKTRLDQTLLIKSRPTPPKQPIGNRIADGQDRNHISSGAAKTQDSSQQNNLKVSETDDASTSRPAPSRQLEATAAARSRSVRPARRSGREDLDSSRPHSSPQQSARKASAAKGMTSEQLAKYSERARHLVNDDRKLMDLLRRVARDGTHADLAYVAIGLYEELRGQFEIQDP